MKEIKLIFVLIVLPLLFFCQSKVQMQKEPRVLIPSGSVRKDLALLKDLVYAIHPGQFMHCTEAEFEKCYDSLSICIQQDTSIIESYKRVCALLSVLKDGHTQANKAPIYNWLARRLVFPFGVYMIKDRFFISRTLIKDRKVFLGKEVLSINGKPMSVLISEIKNYLSIEAANVTALNYELRSFPFYYLLTDSSQIFRISFLNDNGVPVDTIVNGISMNQYRSETRKIVPPISAQFLADSTALLTVNTFSMDDFKYKDINYKKYIDDFFQQMRKASCQKLIIDVRGNSGGSAEIANYLFSYLAHGPYNYFSSICRKNFDPQKWKSFDREPERLNPVDTQQTVLLNGLYCEINSDRKNYWWFEMQKSQKGSFSGKVIVLADGGSFSTTGHFVTLFREKHIGKIVGECTQGSYYSNDGSHTFLLPNTGISVNIPTAQFKMAVNDFEYDAKGICPDVEVYKTINDIKTNSDSQLQAAFDSFREW
jgi:hypothetical protein